MLTCFGPRSAQSPVLCGRSSVTCESPAPRVPWCLVKVRQVKGLSGERMPRVGGGASSCASGSRPLQASECGCALWRVWA